MPRARPRATATIMISSSREPDAEDDPFLVATFLYSLACLLVTGGRRRVSVRGRLRLGDVGLGERLLVDGLTRHFGVGCSRSLRRRVVQQAALDDLLRTRVAALTDAGAL